MNLRTPAPTSFAVGGKELIVKLSTLIVTAAIAALAATAAVAAGPQANVDLRYLAPKSGEYAIDVQNTSSRYLHGFRWVAPAPLRLTRIISAAGGACHLAGNAIECTVAGLGLAPTGCGCDHSDQLTAEFAASGDRPRLGGDHPIYYGVGTDSLTTW